MEDRFRQTACDGARARGEFASRTEFFHATPNFMPVGTQGSVKGVDAERLKESGARL